MSEWYNPDSWMDILDHVLIGMVLVAVAAVPSWFANRNHQAIKKVGQKAEAIEAQVVNGHAEQPQNLRDDMDEVKAALSRWEPVLGMVDELRAGMESLAQQMRAFRSDLMAEEDRRRIQIGDLREDLERTKRGGNAGG